MKNGDVVSRLRAFARHLEEEGKHGADYIHDPATLLTAAADMIEAKEHQVSRDLSTIKKAWNDVRLALTCPNQDPTLPSALCAGPTPRHLWFEVPGDLVTGTGRCLDCRKIERLSVLFTDLATAMYEAYAAGKLTPGFHRLFSLMSSCLELMSR